MDALSVYLPLVDLMVLNCGLALSQFIVLRAGVFSIATAGFAALGAYTAAILAKSHDVPALLALLTAAFAGMVAALVLSVPVARLRGVFQAIATLAFVQIVMALLLYAEPLTGGAMGLNGIAKTATTPLLLACLAVLLYLMHSLLASGIGRAFDVMQHDETVAVAFGIRVDAHHALAFALSGAIAGLTGGLMAFHNYSLVPEEFGFSMLVAALAYVVLGGTRTLWGPLTGATILTLLPEVSRGFADYRLLIHGGLLMLVMAWMPDGVADSLTRHWRQHRHRLREAAV